MGASSEDSGDFSSTAPCTCTHHLSPLLPLLIKSKCPNPTPQLAGVLAKAFSLGKGARREALGPAGTEHQGSPSCHLRTNPPLYCQETPAKFSSPEQADKTKCPFKNHTVSLLVPPWVIYMGFVSAKMKFISYLP